MLMMLGCSLYFYHGQYVLPARRVSQDTVLIWMSNSQTVYPACGGLGYLWRNFSNEVEGGNTLILFPITYTSTIVLASVC